jgi:hypothetical protein
MYSLALIIFVVSEKKAFEYFPIGSNVNLCPAVVAILKPLGQLKPNCPGMIIGRSSTKFMFFMPIGNPRWLPPQVIVLTQDHINIKNTKFVKDLPMIDAQFRFNQCNSFREEYISVFSPYGPVLIL